MLKISIIPTFAVLKRTNNQNIKQNHEKNMVAGAFTNAGP